MLDIDLPDVLAELNAAFDDYERALIGNDIATLNALFWNSPSTVRFGARESERLYGHAEIAAFRLRRGPVDQTRTLRNRRITTFGREFGITNVEYIPGRFRQDRPSEPNLDPDGTRLENRQRSRVVRNMSGSAVFGVKSFFAAAEQLGVFQLCSAAPAFPR